MIYHVVKVDVLNVPSEKVDCLMDYLLANGLHFEETWEDDDGTTQ